MKAKEIGSSKNTPNEASEMKPRMRFPEFRDSDKWAREKVGALISTIVPPKKLLSTEYKKSGHFPIIDQSKDYVAGRTDDEDALVTKDLPVIVFGDHTCALKFVDFPFAQGADGIKIFHGCSGVSTEYLYQSLCYNPLAMEDYKRHYSILRERQVVFPILMDEQQKIAACIASIDNLIAAEGQKLSALKDHKRALVQQLFPTEGETIPRLRFPEFHDAPEWEIKALATLVVLQSGGTPSKANPALWDGSIPWVSAKDMKRLFLDDTQDHISVTAIGCGARLVPAGTLLILTRGMTLLKDVPICVLRREMSFNQDVKALRPKTDLNGVFLALALLRSKQRLLRMVDIAGHGTGKLNTADLEAFEFASPRLAEQQQIAACLSSLDEVLTAQLRKVDSLAAYKKGLMQQLFPILDEVQA